jgi:uncharacterized damage-inducible protein DinB
MLKNYREGAVGALLDIYEQGITDLKSVIADIPNSALKIVIDLQTEDENCRSIQAILTHVIHSMYGYATSIHNSKKHYVERKEKINYLTIKEYLQEFSDAFSFTESVFFEIKDYELEEFDNSLKIKVAWGQFYDIEQLTEHAIVHILRHKRQIEKIKCGILSKYLHTIRI